MSGCSCDFGGLDYPLVYHDEWRVARKEHKCCECLEAIKPGERYYIFVGIWDRSSSWKTFKTCKFCSHERDKMNRDDREVGFGDLACAIYCDLGL